MRAREVLLSPKSHRNEVSGSSLSSEELEPSNVIDSLILNSDSGGGEEMRATGGWFLTLPKANRMPRLSVTNSMSSNATGPPTMGEEVAS